jgi:hypothetical protein
LWLKLARAHFFALRAGFFGFAVFFAVALPVLLRFVFVFVLVFAMSFPSLGFATARRRSDTCEVIEATVERFRDPRGSVEQRCAVALFPRLERLHRDAACLRQLRLTQPGSFPKALEALRHIYLPHCSRSLSSHSGSPRVGLSRKLLSIRQNQYTALVTHDKRATANQDDPARAEPIGQASS